MTTKTAPLAPGDTVHVLDALTIAISDSWVAGGRALTRGDVFTVTSEILELNKNRAGESIFDLVDDPESQVTKFGHVLIGRGDFPTDERIIRPGSIEQTWQLQQARAIAGAIPDEAEQRAAFARIRAGIGAGEDTGQRSTQYTV